MVGFCCSVVLRALLVSEVVMMLLVKGEEGEMEGLGMLGTCVAFGLGDWIGKYRLLLETRF